MSLGDLTAHTNIPIWEYWYPFTAAIISESAPSYWNNKEECGVYGLNGLRNKFVGIK